MLSQGNYKCLRQTGVLSRSSSALVGNGRATVSNTRARPCLLLMITVHLKDNSWLMMWPREETKCLTSEQITTLSCHMMTVVLSDLWRTELDPHNSAPLPSEIGPYSTGKAGSQARGGTTGTWWTYHTTTRVPSAYTHGFMEHWFLAAATGRNKDGTGF